jgi:hypothetical protein
METVGDVGTVIQGINDDTGLDDSSDNRINNVTSADDGENIQTNDNSPIVDNANGTRVQHAPSPFMLVSVCEAGEAETAVKRVMLILVCRLRELRSWSWALSTRASVIESSASQPVYMTHLSASHLLSTLFSSTHLLPD